MKALVRQCGCSGRSEPSLDAHTGRYSLACNGSYCNSLLPDQPAQCTHAFIVRACLVPVHEF